MFRYEVGKIYHPGKTQWKDGTDFNYRANSLELRMFFSSLTHSDIRAIRNGTCTFAFTVIDGVIFFLFEFGKACTWSDNSYSIHLVPENERTIPTTFHDNESALLHIILVEATTGFIVALRVISLSHDFAAKLFDAIRKQATQPFDRNEHDRKIALIYARYPTVESMVQVAQATCIVESKSLQN